MSSHDFQRLSAGVTGQIAARPLEAGLPAWLNASCPTSHPRFRDLTDACRAGVAEGRPCNRKGANESTAA